MEIALLKKEINDLATIVEEGARANKGNIKRFSEPAEGTLRRALARRHHLIFGRRGSGKSSLLYKAASDLYDNDHPVAIVDLEPFKGHQYPDIIISTLIASLKRYSSWINQQIKKDSGSRIWYKPWARKYKPQTVSFKKLKCSIDSEVEELIEQLYLSDDATLKKKLLDQLKKESEYSVSGGGNYGGLSAESVISELAGKSKETEIQEEFKRSKKDYLLRKILDYQNIFTKLYEIGGKHSYIFLDDLYHIHRNDQASLIDYFHKISKGNELWIKIATIRNRTTWYLDSPQPIGVKIGDDADEINLDLTLEKFSTARSFLISILNNYTEESNSPNLYEIITDGGIDRLVLSSGGVTRDFLGLFWRSIDEAKERIKRSDGEHHRGNRIGAEDANLAAGNYGEIKKEEFQKDTPEEREILENTFNNIREFCLDKIKKNIFLINQEDTSEQIELIKQLIDLRLLHQVKSRVTVSARPGKIYKAYLLDVSQYTGERARRDVEMVEFWKDQEKEKLRIASLIFDPNSEASEVPKTKSVKKDRKKDLEKNSHGDQGELKFEVD